MTRRTIYRVADQSLLVDAQDAWAAEATAALFAGWYLDSERESRAEPPSAPPIVVRRVAPVPRIPPGLPVFEIAGGGTCHTDGCTSYIEIDGSIVAIGKPGLADVEVWMNGPLALDAPALTRLATYALSAALRRRGLFELHSAAVVHPPRGGGVLIIGPSGREARSFLGDSRCRTFDPTGSLPPGRNRRISTPPVLGAEEGVDPWIRSPAFRS